MDLKEVKQLLSRYMMELRCELSGWDNVIPLDALRTWIKKVESRIINRIEE